MVFGKMLRLDDRPFPHPLKFWRWMGLVFGAIALVFALSPAVGAIAVQDIPNPRHNQSWISDTANLLTDATEITLNQKLDQLEADTTIELAVVTVDTTKPAASPKAFTTQLFNHWGIGKADKNNGILFLVSTGDRRVEIETGSGMSQKLPNIIVKLIIDQDIIPALKRQAYEEGIVSGVNRLVELVAIAPPQPLSQSPSRPIPDQLTQIQIDTNTHNLSFQAALRRPQKRLIPVEDHRLQDIAGLLALAGAIVSGFMAVLYYKTQEPAQRSPKGKLDTSDGAPIGSQPSSLERSQYYEDYWQQLPAHEKLFVRLSALLPIVLIGLAAILVLSFIPNRGDILIAGLSLIAFLGLRLYRWLGDTLRHGWIHHHYFPHRTGSSDLKKRPPSRRSRRRGRSRRSPSPNPASSSGENYLWSSSPSPSSYSSSSDSSSSYSSSSSSSSGSSCDSSSGASSSSDGGSFGGGESCGGGDGGSW